MRFINECVANQKSRRRGESGGPGTVTTVELLARQMHPAAGQVAHPSSMEASSRAQDPSGPGRTDLYLAVHPYPLQYALYQTGRGDREDRQLAAWLPDLEVTALSLCCHPTASRTQSSLIPQCTMSTGHMLTE